MEKRKPPAGAGRIAGEQAERTAAEQVERTAAEQVEHTAAEQVGLVVEAQAGPTRISYNGYRWGYWKNRI